MKIRITNRSRMLAFGAAAFTGITLVAWQQQPFTMPNTDYRDTIPTREKQLREEKDLDKEMRKLDEAKEKLDQLSSKDLQNLNQNLQKTLNNINLDQLRISTDIALSNADLKKLNEDLRIKLDNIDLKDLKQSLSNLKLDININTDEISKAMSDLRIELKNELGKVNEITRDEVNNALKEAGKELEKAKEDMKDLNLDFSESMQKAKEGLDKAKSVMESFQEMIYDMEGKNLLSTKGDYTVELMGDDLYINDKKQPAEITARYKKYFNDGNSRIRKRDGNISISKRRLAD